MFDPITGYDWHLNWKKKIDETKNSMINKVYYVPLAAAVVKRDVLQQLDENLFLYNEDLDLALSLNSENYFCVVDTKAFAFHNIELRRRSQYAFRGYHHVRGRLYILYKHLHKCFLRTNLEIISSCDSVNLVVRGYDN